MSVLNTQTAEQERGSQDEANDDESFQDKAKRLFDGGKLGESLLVLNAAEAHGQADSRQKLIVQMHISARHRDWWKVV